MSEFDYEIDKLVGVVHKEYPTAQNAKVYVMGYIITGDGSWRYQAFTKDELRDIFKNEGYAHYATPYDKFVNKLISFNVFESEDYDPPRRERFKVDFNGMDFYNHTPVCNIEKQGVIDAFEQGIYNKYYKAGTRLYILNKSDQSKGIAKYWRLNDAFFAKNSSYICRYGDDIYIISDDVKDPLYSYCDMLNTEGVIRYVINVINIHNVKIDELDSLSDGLVKLLNVPAKILQFRFETFKENLESVTLTYQQIMQLASNPLLTDVLQRSIKKYEEEYIQMYEQRNKDIIKKIIDEKAAVLKDKADEFAKLETAHKSKIKEIDREIKKHNIELEQVVARIRKRTKEADVVELRFVEIDKQRDRLIEDFSVIRDVLGGSNSIEAKRVLPANIQRVECDGELIVEFDEFKTLLEQHLSSRDLSKIVAPDIIRLFVAQNDDRENLSVMMFPNVKLIKAFIDSIGQYNLLSLSVGAHWKSFNDLYFEGLKDMIISANKCPNIIHILVLQNMNLSYIPSYMQPINDILTGICNTLPIDSDTIFPANLWIFGTRTSLSDEAIPIPLEYISEYGCVKNKDYFVEGDIELTTIDRYITMDFVGAQRVEERGYKSDPESYLD